MYFVLPLRFTCKKDGKLNIRTLVNKKILSFHDVNDSLFAVPINSTRRKYRNITIFGGNVYHYREACLYEQIKFLTNSKSKRIDQTILIFVDK